MARAGVGSGAPQAERGTRRGPAGAMPLTIHEPAHNPRAHGEPPTVAPFRAWRGSMTPTSPEDSGPAQTGLHHLHNTGCCSILAERVGFEPTVPFPVHM